MKKCQCVKNTCGQPRMFNTRQIKIGAKYQFSNGVDGVAGIGAIVQAVCPSNSMLKCDGNKAWLFDILLSDKLYNNYHMNVHMIWLILSHILCVIK